MSTAASCSVSDCSRPHYGRGYCSLHYQRWRKHGDPSRCDTVAGTGSAQAFYEDVVRSYDGDECLIWPFSKGSDGRYGRMKLGEGNVAVHRRLCEEVNGPPPTMKHEAAHTCGRGHLACVTKRHLVWKTHRENMGDRLIHGTDNRGARNGLAKLNEHDVRQIRQLRGSASMAAIGRQFGVSSGTIHQIYSGKAWSWVR